jgi:hypothetical protein
LGGNVLFTASNRGILIARMRMIVGTENADPIDLNNGIRHPR